MEVIKLEPTTERRQNLPGIEHISAARSGQIDAVLAVLRACEEISLTAEQMDLCADIVQSIKEHGEPHQGLTGYYLIRYGMLLERDRERGGTS